MDGQALARRGGLRRTSIVLTAIAVTVGLLASSGSVSANHDFFLRISTGAINGNGAGSAFFVGASADGTRVFFETGEQLVESDTDFRTDVYQRFNGTTTRISAGAINGNGDRPATFAGASAGGTRVFFITREKLVASDTDFNYDIYQRFNGLTTRISAGAINGNGIFDATFVGASADGTRVFFDTNEQLVASDTDDQQDVYQRFSGVTTRISAGAINGNGNTDWSAATFVGASADGTRVFFRTLERLVSADTDASRDIYQRFNGLTTRISAGAINGNGNGDGSGHGFDATFLGASADGTRVFFETFEQLVASDTDNRIDVYQRFNGVTTRISTAVNNVSGDFDATFVGASADGTRVFFTTRERLVSPDTNGTTDIYQRWLGTTIRITVGAITGSVFFAGASADGTRVFFHSEERLVASDTDNKPDVYQRFNGVTTRISAGAINGNGAHWALFAGASADGTRVFFTTTEQLVAADTFNDGMDIYERFNGLTTRITAGGIRGNGATFATFEGASADGRSVFVNTDERLVASDTDNVQDVYGVYDLP